MGELVTSWEAEEVEGCLVKPLSGSSAAEEGRPGAVRLAARVALPKAYTAGKPSRYFEGARVALTSRGMDPADAGAAFAVVGCPMRTEPFWRSVDLTGNQTIEMEMAKANGYTELERRLENLLKVEIAELEKDYEKD